MIQLKGIDGTKFYINPDLIEVMEATHDTHVTLNPDLIEVGWDVRGGTLGRTRVSGAGLS